MIARIAPALAVLLALPAAADPVRFVEKVKIEDRTFRLPMMVDLVPLSETRVAVQVTGDLRPIQDSLPALLSRHIENRCERRLSLAVSDAVAEGDTIRLTGQIQAEVAVCRKIDGQRIREEMLNQTARVETVLHGEIVEGCLVMRVVETSVRPDGFTGALMNATGYTARLNRDLEEQLDKALTEDDNCLDLPSEFQAFDTVITGGGFRDIGEGTIGAVITGEMDITAPNFIRLIHLLAQEGRLGD